MQWAIRWDLLHIQLSITLIIKFSDLDGGVKAIVQFWVQMEAQEVVEQMEALFTSTQILCVGLRQIQTQLLLRQLLQLVETLVKHVVNIDTAALSL